MVCKEKQSIWKKEWRRMGQDELENREKNKLHMIPFDC
jgi:hypothetical protein